MSFDWRRVEITGVTRNFGGALGVESTPRRQSHIFRFEGIGRTDYFLGVATLGVNDRTIVLHHLCNRSIDRRIAIGLLGRKNISRSACREGYEGIVLDTNASQS
jgi:hypothetical protein